MERNTFAENLNGLFKFIVALAAAMTVAMFFGFVWHSCQQEAETLDWDNVTPEKAVKMGTGWGSKKTVDRMCEMFRLWGPYMVEDASMDAGTLSAFAGPETAWTGNPWARTRDFKDLGEIGLLSLKRETAKYYDVDGCDPRANLWADSLEMWKKRNTVVSVYPWLKKYPRHERDLIADAIREAGAGVVRKFIQISEIEKHIDKVIHPHHYILNFLRKQPASAFNGGVGKAHAVQEIFRFAWVAGSRHQVVKFWGGGKSGREKMKRCTQYNPDRPEGLAPFPVEKGHGYCTTRENEWKKPPKWRWKKMPNGKLKNRWGKLCPIGQSCTWEEVDAKWFDKWQALGVLPSDEDYARVWAEMEAADCWPDACDFPH